MTKLQGFQGTIGTVSHGTLRYVDLIPALVEELERIEPNHAWIEEHTLSGDREVIESASSDHDLNDGYQSLVPYLFEELVEILNDYAPEGYYFGNHPGDGSDYGYWPEEWTP